MKQIFAKLGKTGLFISILVALVITVAVSQVVYDLYTGLTYINVISPKISIAADTSSTIDVSPYIGKMVFVQTVAGTYGTSVTFASKFQQSTNGTTWTSAPTDSAYTSTVTLGDTTVGSVQYKAYDTRKVKRYLRYITTLSASDTIAYGVLGIGQLRNR